MLKCLKIFTILLMLFFDLHAQNLWQPVDFVPLNSSPRFLPERSLYYRLDETAFKQFQHFIPGEDDGNYPLIQLPAPDGRVESFYIFEYSMMEDGLARHYPGIRTYTAVHTENAFKTAKIDFTFWGFHAMVFDGPDTYFIDPYSQESREYYMVYYKRDFVKTPNERMECLFDDGNDFPMEKSISLSTEMPELNMNKTNGTVKRDYRLALACTEEYATAVGGPSPTKNSVLSAMVTSMNRVNGVFQREFSMKAVLVANDTAIIYLPGSGDPYTNNSATSMLSQNQSNLNSVIGSSNYDIGHVFSTGGGGLANLGCVCSNSNKARGVTGSSNPVGDPYDIDYVAHEMGHQFGGSHTFASSSGSCSGNGSNSSAYEIGSGTTIMAYAGICGSDNIQQHSDDYYHYRSLDQISTFIAAGGNCSQNSSTGNNPPNVNPINLTTYHIPYKTFFEIEGSATDPDSDPITYCWEEYDRGGFGSALGVTATRPIFRSFYPTASNQRVCTEWSKMVNENIKYLGEVLPEVQRNLNFRLTVRDIRNGYGSFHFTDNDLSIVVDTTLTLFRVTSQPVAVTYDGLTSQTVTWDVAGTDITPISTPMVDIYFSADTGKTFPYVLASNVPNDGSETISIPNVATTTGKIKVKGHGNIFFDLNNGWITVNKITWPAGLNDVQSSAIRLYPNPADHFVYLDSEEQIEKVFLLSVSGQKQEMRINDGKISFGALANGIYFLEIHLRDGHAYREKLVIHQ